MLSREATITNLIVFGMTRPGLTQIYRSLDGHADNYATDAVIEIDLIISSLRGNPLIA
jgi:hypothetical protein